MFASMVVSFTGLALPLVAGVCIAPKDGRQALFAALRNDVRIAQIRRMMSASRASCARSLAAFHPANLSIRDPSHGHFG